MEHPMVIFKDSDGKWCAPLKAMNGRTGEIYPGYTAHRFTDEVDANKVPWYEGDRGLDKHRRPFVVEFWEGCFWQKYDKMSVMSFKHVLESCTHAQPVPKYKRYTHPFKCPEFVEDQRVSDRRTGTKRPERKTGRDLFLCGQLSHESSNHWYCGKPIGRREGPQDRRKAQRRGSNEAANKETN